MRDKTISGVIQLAVAIFDGLTSRIKELSFIFAHTVDEISANEGSPVYGQTAVVLFKDRNVPRYAFNGHSYSIVIKTAFPIFCFVLTRTKNVYCGQSQSARDKISHNDDSSSGGLLISRQQDGWMNWWWCHPLDENEFMGVWLLKRDVGK